MRCPYCGKDNTRVVDSRPVDDNTAIRRRRMCDSCGKRFTSYEKVEMIPLMVVKKDMNREPFNRNKIEDGVEAEIYNSGVREIPSSAIGELVMTRLKDLDAVAYVRFASVYREFKDVNTFMTEIKKFL